MTLFSNASVFAVPNRTRRIQITRFRMTPLPKVFLNNFGLLSNDSIFERINGTQSLKQTLLNLFLYGNGVTATQP